MNTSERSALTPAEHPHQAVHSLHYNKIWNGGREWKQSTLLETGLLQGVTCWHWQRSTPCPGLTKCPPEAAVPCFICNPCWIFSWFSASSTAFAPLNSTNKRYSTPLNQLLWEEPVYSWKVTIPLKNILLNILKLLYTYIVSLISTLPEVSTVIKKTVFRLYHK